VYDRPVAPADLIDREPEAEQLLSLAEGGHNSRLSAPRRFGKTTLLRRVMADADAAGIATVYVDFFGVLSLDEVVVKIEEAYRASLQGALRRWLVETMRALRPSARLGVPGAGLELTPQPEADAVRLLERMLDLPRGIFERSGRRTLVVFDEFQALLRAGDRIDALIRGRTQHHTDEASYVFAGSHPGLMAELFGARERPLFGQARPLHLGPLEDADLAVYIGARFEGGGREVAAMLEPLLDLARGHPQRAMLLAHHLWEQTPPGATADPRAWSAALASVSGELEEAFERAWRGFSQGQQRVLAAIAWGQEPLYGGATRARFKLTKGAAQRGLDRLIDLGEVARNGRRLQLVDPLFEAWIARGRRPFAVDDD
jgi:uncharacterized protein